MSAKSHHAILSLHRRFNYECKRLKANRSEMEELANHYFRYRELLHEQEQISGRIVRIFGVLGVHSPETSQKLAAEIKRHLGIQEEQPLNSHEVRKNLKLWEILELFLSSVDNKATVGDFRSFLSNLDIRENNCAESSQAVHSAIKTHPELFSELSENGQKFIVLKGIAAAEAHRK